MKKRKNFYEIEYWEEKGLSKVDAIEMVEKIKRENSWRCVEFWIKRGFTYDEALKTISKKQTEICTKRDINKKMKNPYSEEYYIEKGIKDMDKIKSLIKERKDKSNPYLKWNEDELKKVIEKRKKTYYNKTVDELEVINKSRGLNRKELFEKFGDVRATEILINRGKGVRSPYEKRFSKISKDLFISLEKINKDKKFLFGKDEKFILVKDVKNRKGYFVDFIDLDSNKIIEFNGDFWHFNPKKYISESFVILNNSKITAKDVWEKEEIKIKKLTELGYKILIVWENEYLENKDLIINKCNKFINDEKIY